MFVVSLNYIVPLAELDKHMTAHVKYLQKYYKQNVFITSGRKVPRTGGIILAACDSREKLERILQEDPFFSHQLAEFTITEFLTSQSHPGFKEFMNQLKS
jgi:uncharacterized protein YciI